MSMIRMISTLWALLCAAAAAEPIPAFYAPAQDALGGERRLVVAELFTSQSCSSCVPAAQYLEELARRDDVLALGWHVDYWDTLQTRDGRWRDPYSSAEWTERQRAYNRNLRGRRTVYTPQMVVMGAREAVGSARGAVSAHIEAARADRRPVSIAASLRGTAPRFALPAMHERAEAYVVYFRPEASTDVRGGENAGRTFADVNIVTRLRALGPVGPNGARLEAPAPQAGEDCALLVQAPDMGPILAAARCAGG